MNSKVTILLTFCMTLSVTAQSAGNEQSPEAAEAAAREYFTDTRLLTQDGEEVRFFTDVLKDQVVVINFIFTDCSGACPIITEKLKMARDLLGADVGGSIRFVSISIDPLRDTPAAMKAYQEKHEATGNWIFLTGEKDNIENVVKRLGQYNAEVEAHSTLVLAGNVKERYWMKITPTVPPGGIAEKLRLLVEGI